MKTPGIMIVAAAVLLAATASAQEYDLVIVGGRVMDPETRYDAVANVGIEDGRIEIITDLPIRGVEEIDATGLVVAPGFIDTHYHAVDPFATKMALRDGVTTGMDLEQGAINVGAWFDQKVETGWQVNYGTTVSHLIHRMRVHDPEVDLSMPVDFSGLPAKLNDAAKDGVAGWSVTRSNLEQMNALIANMDEDLRQGAVGIGTGSAYMARGLTSYEQFMAQKAAANYGRLTSVHTRFHVSQQTPTEAQIGFDEVLANAMVLRAPFLMAHNNDYGWQEIEEKLQLARAQGYNVWSEYYPYNAGSTGISADFLRPELWRDQYGYAYEDTIYDPTTDSFLTDETYAQIVAEDPGRTVVVYMRYRDPWIPQWLSVPHMTVASDAMAGIGVDGKLLPWDSDYSQYAGHPRTAGTRGAVFRMAREQGVPLMFTIAQASYWVAKHLGDTGLVAMQERGRMQPGMVADLTIFDPEKITDNSTFKSGENGLPTTGIPYVVVNGEIVVNDSVVQEVYAGQPIRFPVEPAGRFEPLDPEDWARRHTLQPVQSPDDTGLGTAIDGPATDEDARLDPLFAPDSTTRHAQATRLASSQTTSASTRFLGSPVPADAADSIFCEFHGRFETAFRFK